MVFKILESRNSVTPTLDYNYDKVADCTARIVAHHKLPILSRTGVYRSFAGLEHTGYPVKEVGFHMAVNPGPDDTCTEDQIIEAIYKTMYKLGYKDQPFLVFRHNDIDRTHYHVVSSRIGAFTKRKINNYNEARKLMDYVRKIGPELGFSIPDKTEQEVKSKYTQGDKPIPCRFVPGKAVYPQLRGIYAHALQYCYADFNDLTAVLERKGVRATLGGSPDAPQVILQGLDANGNPVSAPVSESQAGRSWYDIYEGMRVYHSHSSYSQSAYLKYHVEIAFRESKTAMGVMRSLHKLGIEPVTIGGSIKFVGHKDMAVIDVNALPNHLRDRILNASAKVPVHVSFSEIVRILCPVGQPRGASWSGKMNPSKEDLRRNRGAERAGAMDVDFTDDVGGPKLK